MNAPNSSGPLKTVLVSGDLTNDHFIYTGDRFSALNVEQRGVVRQTTPGGVALLYRLLAHLFDDVAKPGESPRRVFSKLQFPEDGKAETCWEGYALWEPCAGVASDGKADTKNKRWRSIRALGLGEENNCPPPALHLNKSLPGQPDVIVLDDLGLEFRHKKSADQWPFEALADKTAKPWLVLKMAGPVVQGDLWWKLVRDHADQLVVVTSAEDLRAAPARISRGSSWERTAEDLSRELKTHPLLKELARARHVVVRFGKDGVFWRARMAGKDDFRETLVFDPQRIEGEWSQELRQNKIDGRVFGIKAVLVASVAHALAHHPFSTTEELSLAPALRAALDAIRTLQREGHGVVGQLDPITGPGTTKKFLATPGFPHAAVAKAIREGGKGFASLSLPQEKGEQWSLLGPNDRLRPLRRRAHAIAVLVAQRGPGVLENVPYGRFGKLQSVDRHELEQYRSVRQLMLDYVDARRHAKPDDEAKPLAIGVFGPPGAGKSFGVKQIAKLILGDQKPLEFNLSQFEDEKDLLGAFHQVRDRALQGGVPLVFWDEFDSRNFHWLQYFLAPIQDGKFQEGQLTHWIGQSIFVFAGGTSERWEEFGKPSASVPNDQRGEWEQNFRMKKGPDFKSRISGALNVLGPNPHENVNSTTGEPRSLSDVCCPIRRALLLRSMLGLGERERWDADFGLLNALLNVPKFTHGARSLEKIVTHLRTHGGKNPQRAHLPGREILAMHLESPDELLRLCDEALPFQQEAQNIGPQIHEHWWQLGQKHGWKQKYARDFNELSESAKEDNYAAARRIPELLALVGLALGGPDASQKLPPSAVGKYLTDNLELLAEAEHEGWVRQKTLSGWRYGAGPDGKQDRANLLHPSLVPYAELSEEDKQKDRENVLRIPEVAAMTGFSIVPPGGGDEDE